jgi:hypothetical protein
MENKIEHFEDPEKLRILMQDFTRRLNTEPDPREFDKTPDGKAQTLPISFVEMTLDELFLGQWELSDVETKQIFNEVVGTGILTVWHPVTQRPLKRAGFGAVVITQDKDAAVSDFNMTKKKNALDLSFPKLKAEITKNAAQTLGKILGRDINRKSKDVFKPALKPLTDKGLLDAIKRVESGQIETIALAEANFLLTDQQKEMLSGAVPISARKQIGS